MKAEKTSNRAKSEPAAQGQGERSATALRRQAVLREQLRQMFDDVVKEPLPTEFTDLLDRIEDNEQQPSRGGARD